MLAILYHPSILYTLLFDLKIKYTEQVLIFIVYIPGIDLFAVSP